MKINYGLTSLIAAVLLPIFSFRIFSTRAPSLGVWAAIAICLLASVWTGIMGLKRETQSVARRRLAMAGLIITALTILFVALGIWWISQTAMRY